MSVPHAKVRRFPTAEPIQGEATHLDAAIATFASHQLDVVTAAELASLGATRYQIARRARSGLLTRVHGGVFAMAGPLTFEQRVLAACLAAGSGSFASHEPAAYLWQLVELAPHRVDITVPMNLRPRLTNVAVHRSEITGRSEAMSRGHFDVARPMRTLLDLAGGMTPEARAVVVDRAMFKGLVVPQRLAEYASDPRFRTRSGGGVLRRLVRDRLEHGFGESTLETMMIEVLDRYGLPQPQRHLRTTVGGRNVRFDLAYPDAFVAIELDGEGPHRERWQSDPDRHNVTELSRWRVLRFTWHDVTERPLYVAMTVADALDIRPTRWADRHKRPS